MKYAAAAAMAAIYFMVGSGVYRAASYRDPKGMEGQYAQTLVAWPRLVAAMWFDKAYGRQG